MCAGRPLPKTCVPLTRGVADITKMVRPQSRSEATNPVSMISAGQGIALCVLSLLMIGVVMVNSAGMSVDPSRAVTIESLLLSKSTIYMGLAMLTLLGAAFVPIRMIVGRWIEPPHVAERELHERGAGLTGWSSDLVRHLAGLWPLWAFVGAMGLVLGSVYMPGIGKEVNNSNRWVNLHVAGLDSIQPSELAKWSLVIGMAWYCCRNARHMGSFFKGLVPGLMAAGAVSGFIVLEDLGTGALVGMVAGIMLIAAGAKIRHLLILAPLPLAAMAAAIVTSPYRMHRILAFLNPYEDPQGIGYHMIQSMVAVANGQFFGRGLGHGLLKFGYLPEDTTDFLFAIVCEELGVFGAGLVIFLYGALLWCVLSVLKRETSRFMRLVALGVLLTVGIQAMINLGVVTGLGPTKGIALPLLSSGGTGWILTAASLGLVIAMDRTRGQVVTITQAAERAGLIPRTLAEDEADESFRSPERTGSVREREAAADDSRFAPITLDIEDSGATGGSIVATMISSVDLGKGDVRMCGTSSDDVGSVGLIEGERSTSDELMRVQHDAPTVAMSMDVDPGETGLLFAEPKPKSDSSDADGRKTDAVEQPRVVVTAEGREWPPQVPFLKIAPA